MKVNPIRRIKFAKWHQVQAIPDGFPWWESAVWLWQEDECLRYDESAEHIYDAVVRLTGSIYDCASAFTPDEREGVRREPEIDSRVKRLLGSVLAEYDGGDCLYRLYSAGWVVCHSYDGDSLGRVLLSSEKD